MTDQAKIKILKRTITDLLNNVPSGWAMPIGWSRAAEKAEIVLKEIKP